MFEDCLKMIILSLISLINESERDVSVQVRAQPRRAAAPYFN